MPGRFRPLRAWLLRARANVGLDQRDVLTPHAEFAALGIEHGARCSAYRALLAAGDDPAAMRSLREATTGGFPLVGERLKTTLEASGARLERGKPGPRKLAE